MIRTMKRTKNPYQEAISHTGTCKLGGNINPPALLLPVLLRRSPVCSTRLSRPSRRYLLAMSHQRGLTFAKKIRSSIDSDVSDDSRYEAF